MKIRTQDEYWVGVPFPPRNWQDEALHTVIQAIQPGNRPIVRAVTGAGKSYFLSEVSRCFIPSRMERVIITTPTVKLVDQLHATLTKHLGRGRVGRFYTKAKDTRQPYIVCCIPSAVSLAEELHKQGVSVALWIADEAHRTETGTMLDAEEAMGPDRAVGFTATPFRSDPGEALSLWDEIVWNYGPAEAIRDGVVVPWELRFWTGAEDLDIDEVCAQMIAGAVQRAEGPGVVNAITIHDAEEFSTLLGGYGVRAEPIHSKLHEKEQERLIKMLEGGKIDCLVHVSLLQEGVDFPWLMWLCLRRPVKSRVRFIQEVGRVLRSYKDKLKAIIYDPHDLFASFRLDYNAILSGDVDENDVPVEAMMREVSVYVDELFSAPLQRLEARPRFMGSVSAYLRQLSVAFDAAGRTERATSTHWRKDKATDRQVKAIWRMKFVLKMNHSQTIPDGHRMALAVAVERREELTKGEAGDLLNVLKSLQGDPSWPDLCSIMVSAQVA